MTAAEIALGVTNTAITKHKKHKRKRHNIKTETNTSAFDSYEAFRGNEGRNTEAIGLAEIFPLKRFKQFQGQLTDLRQLNKE